ncbi:MAG: N-acetylmuramoyl-L-alanine amidase [Saprospiraceae bacterium]
MYGISVKYNIKSDFHPANEQDYAIHIDKFELLENKFDNKKIVVVDAGHGGHDPGASGKISKEKVIALEIALKLGTYINNNHPDIEVIYTRKKDIFIPLHKRIGIAKKSKADLFISIHCNYVGNPNVCGTESYVMGLHRAEENLNVAKRENSVVLLENEYEDNYAGYDPNSPVGHIMLSMFQNVFIDNSIKLASNIESNLKDRKSTKSRGVKQAGFVVLRQATMPAVLVETGFLSNAKEEKYLISKSGQVEIAKSIGDGVFSYLGASSNNEVVLNTNQEIEDKPEPNKSKEIASKYKIQIGVFSKKKSAKYSSALSNYGVLYLEEINGLYKYSVKGFQNIVDAKAIAQLMVSDGFVGAFVVKM